MGMGSSYFLGFDVVIVVVGYKSIVVAYGVPMLVV